MCQYLPKLCMQIIAQFNGSARKLKYPVGMGRVLYSGLSLVLGFKIQLRSGLGLIKFGLGQVFYLIFQSILIEFDKNGIWGWWTSACKNHWQKWWTSACQITMLLNSGLSGWTKLYLGLLGFSKLQFGLGLPKRPWVGSNLGSGFDLTHP